MKCRLGISVTMGEPHEQAKEAIGFVLVGLEFNRPAKMLQRFVRFVEKERGLASLGASLGIFWILEEQVIVVELNRFAERFSRNDAVEVTTEGVTTLVG